MKPDKEYLKQLIEDTLKKFNDFECDFFDFSEAEISYITTKKRFSIGYVYACENCRTLYDETFDDILELGKND